MKEVHKEYAKTVTRIPSREREAKYKSTGAPRSSLFWSGREAALHLLGRVASDHSGPWKYSHLHVSNHINNTVLVFAGVGKAISMEGTPRSNL